MKKYLILVYLTSLLAHGESNPFNLDKNLEKIDKDQEMLLSTLKEIDKKNAAVRNALPVKVDENIEIQNEVLSEMAEENIDEVSLDNSTRVIQEKAKREEVLSEVPDDETLLKQKEEELALARQQEQERLEVEAYEAQRLAKRQKALEAEKSLVVDINISREEEQAKELADKEYLKAVLEMGGED